MASVKKIIEKWKRINYRAPEPVADVEKVIESYLHYDNYIRNEKGGSHNIIVTHDALKDHLHCNYKGEFTIPVHKKKVLAIYYKRLLQIIDIIKEYENEKRS